MTTTSELVGKSEDELMDMFDLELGEELNELDNYVYAERFIDWLKGHGIVYWRLQGWVNLLVLGFWFY